MCVCVCGVYCTNQVSPSHNKESFPFREDVHLIRVVRGSKSFRLPGSPILDLVIVYSPTIGRSRPSVGYVGETTTLVVVLKGKQEYPHLPLDGD